MTSVCEYCGEKFKRIFNLQRHVQRWHIKVINILCCFCQEPFDNIEQWQNHMNIQHKPRTKRWKLTSSAFSKKVVELTMIYNETMIEKALGDNMEISVTSQLLYYLRLHGSIRFQFNFAALMKKDDIMDTWFFQSNVQNVLSGEYELRQKITDEFSRLRQKVIDFDMNHEGSGWSFVTAEGFTIRIVKISSKTMGRFIPFKPRNENNNILRSAIRQTINVKNYDDKCVLYNIVLAKFSSEIKGDLTNPSNLEKYIKFINQKDVEYPVMEKDIHFLEMNNRSTLNIAINIWKFYSTNHIEPFFISKNISRGHTDCNMIMIQSKQGSDDSITNHLIYIKDLNALFRETGTTNQQRKKKYFCPVCKCFKTTSHKNMSAHFKQCRNPNFFNKYYAPARAMYLPEGNIIPPPNSYRTSSPVLRGFFDFETLHKKNQKVMCEICYQRLKKLGCMKKITMYCKHQKKKQIFNLTELPAICFSLILVNQKNKKVFEAFHTGEDSAEYFTQLLLNKEDSFMEYIDRNMKMKMTDMDKEAFKASTHCEQCGKIFNDEIIKCRDHDHFSGKFRSALCNFCNLQKKNLLYIPLYCHNLSGFDSHLIVKAFQLDKSRFNSISRNEEKLITMQIGNFKLIDTMSFMPESLENLTKFLKEKGGSKFIQTKKLAQNKKSKLNLLLCKGIFPYEYISNKNKIHEQCLPSKEEFYSTLKEKHISEEEYNHALNVWKKFKCKTIKDYMKLYCRSDVHLLADVWNNFCIETSKHLKIHPEAGYITLPSYAFDCFKYKMYNEKGMLMNVIDEDMKTFHTDISKGIRGGSVIIKQKAAFDSVMEKELLKMANKEELKEFEEIHKIMVGGAIKERCLIAFDFNNLYGHSMTSKMPLDNFEAMTNKDILKHQSIFDNIFRSRSIKHYYQDSDVGFIFCAQLEFPKETQERLLDFPLAPEQLIIDEEMLSEGQRQTWSRLFSQPYSSNNHKKMVNSFAVKKEYTSHYRLLSFLASLGVKIKLLRGYSFHQVDFISSYVLFCSEQRKQSNNNADKKLWKNMANIIYGKFIGKLENIQCIYILF